MKPTGGYFGCLKTKKWLPIPFIKLVCTVQIIYISCYSDLHMNQFVTLSCCVNFVFLFIACDLSTCFLFAASMGEAEGKAIGQWFGPNTIAQVLKYISEFFFCFASYLFFFYVCYAVFFNENM